MYNVPCPRVGLVEHDPRRSSGKREYARPKGSGIERSSVKEPSHRPGFRVSLGLGTRSHFVSRQQNVDAQDRVPHRGATERSRPTYVWHIQRSCPVLTLATRAWSHQPNCSRFEAIEKLRPNRNLARVCRGGGITVSSLRQHPTIPADVDGVSLEILPGYPTEVTSRIQLAAGLCVGSENRSV